MRKFIKLSLLTFILGGSISFAGIKTSKMTKHEEAHAAVYSFSVGETEYTNWSEVVAAFPVNSYDNTVFAGSTVKLLRDMSMTSPFGIRQCENLILDLNGHSIQYSGPGPEINYIIAFEDVFGAQIINTSEDTAIINCTNSKGISLTEGTDISFGNNIEITGDCNVLVNGNGSDGSDLVFDGTSIINLKEGGYAAKFDGCYYPLFKKGTFTGAIEVTDVWAEAKFLTKTSNDAELVFNSDIHVSKAELDIDGGTFKDQLSVFLSEEWLKAYIKSGIFESDVFYSTDDDATLLVTGGCFKNGTQFIINNADASCVKVKHVFVAGPNLGYRDETTPIDGCVWRLTRATDMYRANPIDATAYPYCIFEPLPSLEIVDDLTNNYFVGNTDNILKFTAIFDFYNTTPADVRVKFDGVALESGFSFAEPVEMNPAVEGFKDYLLEIRINGKGLAEGDHTIVVTGEEPYKYTFLEATLVFGMFKKGSGPVGPGTGGDGGDTTTSHTTPKKRNGLRAVGDCFVHFITMAIVAGYLAFVIVYNWILRKEQSFFYKNPEDQEGNERVYKKHALIPCGATGFAIFSLIILAIFSRCALCITMDILLACAIGFGFISFIIKEKVVALFKKIFKKD